MQRLLVQTNGVSLPLDTLARRRATRPLHLQQNGFKQKFDDRTLVYCAVQTEGDDSVRLIAPPFFNLWPAFRTARFEALPSNATCAWNFRILDRQVQISVKVPTGTQALLLVSNLGTFRLEIASDQNSLFNERRVLFTKSKDNRLDWILDWIKFHRDLHFADAVLLYDNASTAYNSQALLERVAGVAGIKSVAIVDWPFPYGPPGLGKGKYWDSNFTEYAILEDARWRFLQKAKSVLYLDVDELLLPSSREGIFTHVEKSRRGVVSFLGDWVIGFDGPTASKPGHAPRHKDYSFVERARGALTPSLVPSRWFVRRCMPKWAMVPAKCPASAQWHTHNIKGWTMSRYISRHFVFRHFREINLSWKYDRTVRCAFDESRFYRDPRMLEAFSKVDW